MDENSEFGDGNFKDTTLEELNAICDSIGIPVDPVITDGWFTVDQISDHSRIARRTVQDRLYKAMKEGKIRRIRLGRYYYYRECENA